MWYVLETTVIAVKHTTYYLFKEMTFNSRASEQIEKIRRTRAELHEMLKKLDSDIKALEKKKGIVPPSISVLPQIHPFPSVHFQKCQMPNFVENGFDISNVEPIFLEAAKDKTLRIRFMDCTNLAIQCARVRHKS